MEVFMAKCKNCGSDVRFDPETQLLKCDVCGEGARISAQDALSAEKQEYADTKEFICPQCGGSIYTTDSTAATFCSFCGTSVVLECRDAEYEKPDGIIPFRVTQDEAKAAYLAKIRKSLFAPSYLKDDKKIEKIRGIYMPYQVARYHGEGYTAIQSLHHRASGNYDIIETMRDTMHADVSLDMTHDALREFSNIISEGIAPFDQDDVKEYSPAYLSGFYADKSDVGKEVLQSNTETEAKQLCEDAVIKKSIKGNQLKNVESMPRITCDRVDTVLCPVWFISNKQSNGSVSYAAVNGQTGEVAAEVPIDKKKFLIVAGIVSLIAYIFSILSMSFTPHNAVSIMGALALVAAYVLREEAEELYVHNKELEGIDVPVKKVKPRKPIQVGVVVLIFFFGWMPAMFCVMLLYYMFGVAGLIAAGLGCFLLLKKALYRQPWFREIFGRDYEIPKGALRKYIIKPLAAAVFAFFVYLANPVQDFWQYSSAGIVFAITLWSYLDIIKVHNQIASRKPAQLMKRGGDMNA
jgi:hypothetical protein